MPKKRKSAKRAAKKTSKKAKRTFKTVAEKPIRIIKGKKYTHATHPGMKQDHHTLFIFWVISSLLLIIVVALIRAAA